MCEPPETRLSATSPRNVVSAPLPRDTSTMTPWQQWKSGALSTGWILVPLRLFLGVTFTYAALYKIADKTFLDATSSSGIFNQMKLAADNSPFGAILNEMLEHSTAIGVLMIIGELAVGVGMLLGIYTRIAATGGALIALSLVLTVSWGTTPYFYGADIPYVFAFIPFVLAPDGGPFSVSNALKKNKNLEQDDQRRTLVKVGAAAGAAVVLGGVAAAVSKISGQSGGGSGGGSASPSPSSSRPTSSSPAPTSSSPAPTSSSASPMPTGPKIAAASDVPVGGAQAFQNPGTGEPAFCVQPQSGQYAAFSAVCTHEGCTVDFRNSKFMCPCHGAEFDAATGEVLRGPARDPLPPIAVVEAGNDIYLA